MWKKGNYFVFKWKLVVALRLLSPNQRTMAVQLMLDMCISTSLQANYLSANRCLEVFLAFLLFKINYIKKRNKAIHLNLKFQTFQPFSMHWSWAMLMYCTQHMYAFPSSTSYISQSSRGGIRRRNMLRWHKTTLWTKKKALKQWLEKQVIEHPLTINWIKRKCLCRPIH